MTTQLQIDALNAEVASLTSQLADLQTSVDGNTDGLNIGWLLTSGVFVFFMQAGFAMLEAGSVRSKNTINILFKNLIDGAISAISYWAIGYGLSYGATESGIFGTTKFGLNSNEFDLQKDGSAINYQSFFFAWTFAATACTIVSGSVAERCKLEAYFLYSFFISVFMYPIIVHWCWGEGWLSAFGLHPEDYLLNGLRSNNFIDYAGSGVVHTVGGVSGLVGAIMVGPRIGRFAPDGSVKAMPGHSIPYVVLGTLILWVGWYGFNAGSTLCLAGDCGRLAAKIATTTTISGAAGAITMVVYQMVRRVPYDVGAVCNGLLAGLVGVTASCAVVDVWASFLIGISSCLVFLMASKALLALKIDDPLDAAPLHGGAGIWGCLAVGIFGTDQNAAYAGYKGSAAGAHPFRDGEQFVVQIIGISAITGFTLFFAVLLFSLIKFTVGLRVSGEIEGEGLDSSEHGGKAYELEMVSMEAKSNDV